MIFCPKCGSLLKPKTEAGKRIMACSCGFKNKDTKDATIRVKVKADESAGRGIADTEDDMKALPEIDAECPKCGHGKARFWLVQTRAADEPETKFLKCEKCKHTWRDYS